MTGQVERSARPHSGYVFGLRVRSEYRVRWLHAAPATAGPFVDLELARDPLSVCEASERIVELLRPDGSLHMAIDRDADGTYLVRAPRHGDHRVAPDGSYIQSVLPSGADLPWHRLLFAQVLPLAALLRGTEVLHASAVVVDGHAVCFVGPSGVGKTSLAIGLAMRGFPLLADDVVAVDSDLTAHPGPRLAAVSDDVWAGMAPADRDEVATHVGRADKLLVEVSGGAHPVPLGAVYFVERVAGQAGFSVDPQDQPDAVRLLASSFIAHVQTPERLVRQLNLAARLAADVRCGVVRIGGDAPVADVLIGIERALDGFTPKPSGNAAV
jgi:hypothetical protein